MKFEEILPAFREGKAIKRTKEIWRHHNGCFQLIDNRLYDLYENWVEEINVEDLLADDWEIVEEKKKVKLRDLTEEQYNQWCKDNCKTYDNCSGCPFERITCFKSSPDNWVNNKDLYSDKFLDQEIEIEVEK